MKLHKRSTVHQLLAMSNSALVPKHWSTNELFIHQQIIHSRKSTKAKNSRVKSFRHVSWNSRVIDQWTNESTMNQWKIPWHERSMEERLHEWNLLHLPGPVLLVDMWSNVLLCYRILIESSCERSLIHWSSNSMSMNSSCWSTVGTSVSLEATVELSRILDSIPWTID